LVDLSQYLLRRRQLFHEYLSFLPFQVLSFTKSNWCDRVTLTPKMSGPQFTRRELKTDNKISGTIWPAWSPGLSLTENVCFAIILKKMWSKREQSWSTQPVGFGGLCLLNIPVF